MLRNYQIDLAQQTCKKLQELHIVYLAFEWRVGKTLTALKAADLLGMKNVLCVTEKKAIGSIRNDYINGKFKFRFVVTNYEQLHKFTPEYDLIIADESQNLGAFPVANIRTKRLKEIVKDNYLILLSATVTPEGYSQIYHQFWISDYSPFVKYTNFYKWAKDFVNIKQKIFTGVRVNDYSHANEKMILPIIEPYMLTYTQEQAGFNYSEIQEEVKLIPTEPRINTLVNLLLANHYYKMRDGSEIVCDSAVKLQSKIHQIYSGTVKVEGEEEKARILDTSKADYIRQNYIGLKIAIFYKFVAEGQVLKNTFKNWTDTPELFNSSKDKVFICQIASGSKGINLASADVILFYNIDFSCDKYLQARQRLQTMNREKPPLVHWLFSADGIEKKIYDIVRKKRDYTLRYFAKDFLTGKGFN